MTSRREFLRTSTLAMSSLGLASFPGLASAIGQKRFDRISVGETFVFPEWLSAMEDVAAGGAHSADRAFWSAWQSAGRSLTAPANPETFGLVALAAPGVEPFNLARARSLSIQANDRLAELTSAGQGGLATLAAFDPLAVREAERAVTRLGLAGLSLGANRGLRLDHPTLRPVYEFAASQNVMIYLPASYASGAGESPYRARGSTGIIAGAAADSAAHATQLIFGGVLDAFPGLRVVLSRMGEATPYWYGRIHETYSALKESGGALPNRPMQEYFGENIFLTTTGMTAETLQFCSSILGNGRVLSSHEPSARALAADASRLSVDLHRLTRVEASRLVRMA